MKFLIENIRILIVIFLLALHIAHLSARERQGESAEESMDSISLSDVVITGTRTPKSLKDTPVPTRLITAKDIERADATNVQDLLQQEMPGVEFSYAMNQQVNLNMSGFGGQSILFLADGERLSGEIMDNIDFTRLVMNDVQRIEIVRGAASALYGSNAGGGVINIITREDTRPWSFKLDSRWSRHHGQRYGVQFGMNHGRWNNLFTATFNNVDSYKVDSDQNPQTRVYSEVYGEKVVNVKDRLIFRAADNIKLTGRLGYFVRQVPRVVTEPERYRDFSAGLRGVWDISKSDNLEFAYSFDQYDKSSKLQALGLDIRTYSNVQNVVRALYTKGLSTGTGTFGFDYMRDYLYNSKLENSRHHQHSFDAFAQYDWNINHRWELVSALRYDYFSDGNISRLTPKISVRYLLTPNPSLVERGKKWEGVVRASYGMGFRAPSLKEKYYDFDMAGIWVVTGNPDLKPEVSHNINASVELGNDRCDLMLMGFYNNVRNKIASGVPIDGKLPYVNLNRYHVYGGELSARYLITPTEIKKWRGSVRLAYAFTKESLPKTDDGIETNNQYIPARPHSLTWEGTYDRDFSTNYALGITLSGRFLSSVSNTEYIDYYDVSKGTTSVCYPAYSLWKLSIVQRLWQKVRVTIAFDNIFNYKPRYYYYNAPLTDGTNVMLGLSVEL